MDFSPFKFGQIVSGDHFTNRTVELDFLKNNLFSGNHVVILSPRRTGKTSLVKQFIYKSEEEGDRNYSHLFIDLFKTRTEEEFYAYFARELIKASTGKIEEWIELAQNIFKRVIPKIQFGTDPMNDFSISFNVEEAKKHRDEILSLPQKLAEKKGKKVIVYIDEFQNIGSYPDSLSFQKNLRSEWQGLKDVSFCLFGSKRHMMSELFEQSEKPFYQFGSVLPLNRINEDHWKHFLSKKFKSSGKIFAEPLLSDVIQLMENHPHYMQQLAHFIWTNTESSVNEQSVEQAIEFILSTNQPYFIKVEEELSNTQLNLLKAVHNGERQLTSKKTMDNYLLGTPRNVSKNKQTLYERDLIEFNGDKWIFLDPLFKLWFQRNIML